MVLLGSLNCDGAEDGFLIAVLQIQINLGHESLETTQRYLGEELDYQHAPGDYLGLNIKVK